MSEKALLLEQKLPPQKFAKYIPGGKHVCCKLAQFINGLRCRISVKRLHVCIDPLCVKVGLSSNQASARRK
jgi:hypothetical protein